MSEKESTKDAHDFAAYVGIDWADEKHDFCLREAEGERCEKGEIKQTPEAIAEWVSSLRKRWGGRKIAVCLEQSKGALIYALMTYDFIVVYPVNPLTLSKYRKAFAPSGAKNDSSDAELLVEILLKHGDKLTAWKPDDERTRSIAILVEARRGAIDDRTRLSNRLNSLLKNYFPQALQLIGESPCTIMACEFLLTWPTLEAIKRAREHTVREFYQGHRMRSEERIKERLDLIEKGRPLTTDKAIIETSVITVKMIAEQLLCLARAITEYDKRLEELFSNHPDAKIFSSFPGAGSALAPRLLAAFGTDRGRIESADQMQCLSGIAPVTEQSGKSMWVHWRWACPTFVRQSFHEFANQSRHFSLWAGAYYAQQRGRGKGHHAALRGLAFKWIRIMYRCWKDRVIYDDSIYLATLIKRGSPLLKYIAQEG